MSRIPDDVSTSNLTKLEDVVRYFSVFMDDVQNVVNGNLELGVNIKSQVLNCNFLVANQTYGFLHSLGKPPIGYIAIRQPISLNLYDGAGGMTSTNIYLKCDQSVQNVSVLIF